MTGRLLERLVRALPSERAEWGEAMLAEAGHLRGVARLRWVLGVLVAVIPWLLQTRQSRAVAAVGLACFLLALPPRSFEAVGLLLGFVLSMCMYLVGSRLEEDLEKPGVESALGALATSGAAVLSVRVLSLDAPIRHDVRLPLVLYGTALASAMLTIRAARRAQREAGWSVAEIVVGSAVARLPAGQAGWGRALLEDARRIDNRRQVRWLLAGCRRSLRSQPGYALLVAATLGLAVLLALSFSNSYGTFIAWVVLTLGAPRMWRTSLVVMTVASLLVAVPLALTGAEDVAPVWLWIPWVFAVRHRRARG